MKPRNKFQKEIAELSKQLPKITRTQIKWGYKHCVEHIGRRTAKGVISCFECGHSWTNKDMAIEECACPSCGMKLKIETTRKRTNSSYEYFCIITECKGYQVIRFFYIDYRAKVGEKAKYFHSEVIQRWIATNGKTIVMAKLRGLFGFYDTWQFCSSLEIRPDKSLYNAIPTCIYPRQKLIPEIKRSGYKGDFYELTPLDLFLYLLTENKAETLLKAGQTKSLKYFAYNQGYKNISNYWTPIKICIRNKYNINDVSLWCDYIDLLHFFGKDLHNAKYVCPADLNAEHDRYVEKKRAYIKQQQKEEDKKRALEDELLFQEMKSKFFGISFTDGQVQVRVLESVQEIMQEGDIMHHCVFTNDYHLKTDSLILSACIGEKRLETVEISLSKLQVIQSRGVCNKNTKYHNQIVGLVNKNMKQIKKRLVA
ncbi:PcfJ domain-containing protein [Bacteroides sp. 224]|uniref:PcfJ domain-containing protein n=1 Tax=Bacteroides sp. 224 TaxID=2302936 RepID=UPI0013D83DF7|nr:PcfJ domain-containing protein [Bacteroides sp. 224]NDV64694.1 PcfJ-like protein [Bacteroides sp. 224]